MDTSFLIRLVDQFTGPAAKIKRGLKGLGTAATEMKRGFNEGIKAGFSIENLETATRNAEQKLNKAKQRLMGAAAMGAVLIAPLKMAGDFQDGMARVSTLIDTTTESMGDMKAEILGISSRVPVALSSLSGALYDVRSAGIIAADAMDVLEGSARLAIAGQGDTGAAVDLVTSSINSFNLVGEKQAGIYDVIFKAVKNGKTTINELAQGFGAVAGTIASAKIEVDEYFASVAALTTTGMPAAQAHTQIRAAIAGLTRETKKSKALFKSLGVQTFKDLVEKSGGMVEAFELIREEIGDNDAALLNLFGSVEAVNAVLGLTGAQSKVFKQTLGDMRHGTNAVDQAFEKMTEGMNAQVKILRNQLTAIAVAIGEQLIPAIMQMVTELRPIVEGMTQWMQANPELTGNIVKTTAAILAFNVAARLVGYAIAAVRGPLIALSGMFLKFNSVGKNVSKGWWVLLRIGSALSAVFRVMMFVASAAGAALAGITAPVWGLIAAIVAAIMALAFVVWKFWDRISSFVSGFLAPFQGLASGISTAIGNAISDMMGHFERLTGIDLSSVHAKIANFFDFTDEIAAVNAAFAGFWEGVKSFFSREILSDAEKAQVRAAGQDIGQAIVDGIKAGAQAVWDWFAQWPAMIMNAIGPIDLSLLFNWGEPPSWLSWIPGVGNDQAQLAPLADGAANLNQNVKTTIAASVTDTRPPSVTVNAPITITGASDAKAVAAQVKDQLGRSVSNARTGSLHGGVGF